MRVNIRKRSPHHVRIQRLIINLKDQNPHTCINDMEELRGAISMLTNEAENGETVKRLEAADEMVKKGIREMDAAE